MARFDSLTAIYDFVRDPLSDFIMFLDPATTEGISGTEFGRDEDQGERKATCGLDYMFVWLVEGDGARYCPTFESWLLTVIAFADELGRDRMASSYAGDIIGGPQGIRGALNLGSNGQFGLLQRGAKAYDQEFWDSWVDETTQDKRSAAQAVRPADDGAH